MTKKILGNNFIRDTLTVASEHFPEEYTTFTLTCISQIYRWVPISINDFFYGISLLKELISFYIESPKKRFLEGKLKTLLKLVQESFN